MTKKNKDAAPVGRPSGYKPEYCQVALDLFKVGASKAEVCLELDCCFNTFIRWQDENEEFMKAVKRGLSLSKGKWEQMGRKAAYGEVEGFNATAWIFNMKNRFGKPDSFEERWSDKQELEHSGQISSADAWAEDD